MKSIHIHTNTRLEGFQELIQKLAAVNQDVCRFDQIRDLVLRIFFINVEVHSLITDKFCLFVLIELQIWSVVDADKIVGRSRFTQLLQKL